LAGGSVGKYIAQELAKTGKHVVTALTRPGSKLPDGVRAVNVDYNDESSLVSALEGQQLLIITVSVMEPPDTHSKYFADEKFSKERRVSSSYC
jgi:uncharacterized protein YbjT (DUF2867 family)